MTSAVPVEPGESLPTPSRTLFRRIVTACDRFEAAWRGGRRPRIADYLEGIPEPEAATLTRELQALERELLESGPEPDPPPREAQRHPHSVQQNGLPATIGKYLVLGTLGQGGQGQVYRVVHPGLGRELVLKIALDPIGHDQRAREQLLAEGWLLAELNHPNLVRIFDLDFHDGRPFLVMEWVEGVHLEQHRRSVSPTIRQAVVLMAELCRVVGFVHRHGVIHHDIKPKNILIDRASKPRLIDFGLAQLRPAWKEIPSGGTPSYMSPEQARMEPNLGPRSDVFSLGAVLYFLVTGHAPFEGRSRDETWQKAAHGRLDLASLRAANLPQPLERVCLKALEPDADSRHQTADDLADELLACLRPAGGSSASQSLLNPVPRPDRDGRDSSSRQRGRPSSFRREG